MGLNGRWGLAAMGAALESFDMVDVDFSVIIVCVLWPKLEPNY